MIRKILQAQDPLLRKRAKPVQKIDKKTSAVIKDLKDTLAIQKDPEGVGLAAPQIGKNLKIFVIKYGDIERVMINPQVLKIPTKKKAVTKRSKKRVDKEIMEGCLSLPNYYSPLKRASRVTVKYLDGEGHEVIEEFKGFYAQIVLHEIDHLEGILFIDRLLEQKQPLFKLSGKEWEEVELT